jgi:nicotinamide riboside kinase
MAERGILMISKEELVHLDILNKVIKDGLKQVDAAEILELTARHVNRLVKRIKAEGESGIVHRSRGKRSNRRLGNEFKNKIMKKYDEKYEGFGPTLFAEKLYEIEKIKISDETIRCWLIGSNRWKRHRKRDIQRHWRERQSYYGEMQQMDGSHHDWLEGRGPKMVLMAYIDDATSRIYCRFYEYEGTIPAMDSFWRYIVKYGLPLKIYLDKHTTYKSTGKATLEQELNGEEPMSQFERGLKELGVKVIHANSPQAKGRIERLFNTLQDRLVKELRLRGINSLEGANKFLEEYTPVFNKRFNIMAKAKGNLHRELPAGINLKRVLCIKTERALRNDFTVTHDKKLYQILEYTKAKHVTVEEWIDGSFRIYNRDKLLRYREIMNKPEKPEIRASDLLINVPKKKWIPPADHPWRRYKHQNSTNFAAPSTIEP